MKNPSAAISQVTIFISRFNVDCSASPGLYGGVEGAFGAAPGAGGYEAGEVGQCPAPGPASPEDCAGAVSNCWSPGQRDTGEKIGIVCDNMTRRS